MVVEEKKKKNGERKSCEYFRDTYLQWMIRISGASTCQLVRCKCNRKYEKQRSIKGKKNKKTKKEQKRNKKRND